MTNDERGKIARMAAEMESKRMVYESHAMRNQPIDPDERIDSAVAYQIAWSEYMEAQNRLTNFQKTRCYVMLYALTDVQAKWLERAFGHELVPYSPNGVGGTIPRDALRQSDDTGDLLQRPGDKVQAGAASVPGVDRPRTIRSCRAFFGEAWGDLHLAAEVVDPSGKRRTFVVRVPPQPEDVAQVGFLYEDESGHLLSAYMGTARRVYWQRTRPEALRKRLFDLREVIKLVESLPVFTPIVHKKP